MCLTRCNTFQKHLLSQRENLIFWPQKWIFEISEAIFDSFWHPNMRKRHGKATLKVSKKNLRPSIKNRLDTFVPNVLGINLIPFSWSYDQNWLRETLKTEKKAKTPPKWAFWNNRLQMLTKCKFYEINSRSDGKNAKFIVFSENTLIVQSVSKLGSKPHKGQIFE